MSNQERKVELAETLRIDEKSARIKQIEAEMATPSFWQEHQRAAKLTQELKHLQDFVAEFESAETEAELEELETEAFFSGDHDDSSCFVGIHSGSGGVDAQDWAEMLTRMYTRYGERADYKVTLLDQADGEEAGIKNATLLIEGFRAYGKLKAENGVHRLVRISPFDAAKARHTSFALVEVVPEVADAREVEINTDEIRIDVYRAGGRGGQGVNTTDSAVRITHLPTKIVVTCQNERSQLQNKVQALKILQGKLQLLDDEKRRIANQNHKGEPVLASWGNQIRSYVLQPYQMVKDLRSGYETSGVDDVLDGRLENLINANIKHFANLKKG
ncbi:MAG: peptide chain release factor 2 [Patescibacteria group bacterium]